MANIDSAMNNLGFQLVEKINKIENEKLKKKLLSNIEKSLGVLTNDGVYAYYVFCKAQDKNNKNNFQKIFIELPMGKLREFVISESNNSEEKSENFFQNLSNDLPNLLFFRQLLERALIYARYHAKAMGDEGE